MVIHELIIRYLMKNQSVSLSGLGKFSKEFVDASIHPIIHEFYPPHSILLFEENSSCETTPEFIQLCIQESGLDQAETLCQISKFTESIQNEIKASEKFSIDQFGTFSRTLDHGIGFDADDTLALSPDVFGMPSFKLHQKGEYAEKESIVVPEPVSVVEDKQDVSDEHVAEKDLVVEQELQPIDIQEPVLDPTPVDHQSEEHNQSSEQDQVPVVETETTEDELEIPVLADETKLEIPVQKKGKNRIPVWIILLFVIIGGGSALYLTGYWEIIYSKAKNIIVKNQTVTAETETLPSESILENTENEENEELVSDTSIVIEPVSEDIVEVEQSDNTHKIVSDVNSDIQLKYFIVADCFSKISFAEKRVVALQTQGYNSSIAGQTKQGLHIVTYGGYADKAVAEAELEKIQKTVKKEAWLYSK